jgi:hypothetical protein
MEDGMVFETSCAFTEEVVYADTTPGRTRARSTSPETRLIVLDLAKILIESNGFLFTVYKLANRSGFSHATLW